MLKVIAAVRSLKLNSQFNPNIRNFYLSPTYEAARKGTREKARKKKVKVEVKKVGFIPHNQRNKDKLDLKRENKHIDDSWKAIPYDNCFVGKYYRWVIYEVAEAIECHRETHHPTMYNVPNAPLNAHIELNMKGEKANRFVDNFNRMAMIPHKFEHNEERKILVFTKTTDTLLEAREAGATLVGGVELIKDIQNGELLLTDYQYVIAHTNILPELVPLRGLMKKKFPNPKSGTLGTDLRNMIEKFSNGISYTAIKDDYQQDFGLITTSIGTLNMKTEELEENLAHLLQDINTFRPKREGAFITRVLLKSPPSPEHFKINPFKYIPEENEKLKTISKKETKVSEEDEEKDELEKASVQL